MDSRTVGGPPADEGASGEGPPVPGLLCLKGRGGFRAKNRRVPTQGEEEVGSGSWPGRRGDTCSRRQLDRDSQPGAILSPEDTWHFLVTKLGVRQATTSNGQRPGTPLSFP